MNSDDRMIIICMALFFVSGFSIGAGLTTLVWEGSAISEGHALYCPTTGEFAWKGKCDD